jgi:hypothetical protein
MRQRIHGIRATQEDVEALERVLAGTGMDKTTWLRRVIHAHDKLLRENGLQKSVALPGCPAADPEMRIRHALAVAATYAHTADPSWVLDQIVHMLVGDAYYPTWVAHYNAHHNARWRRGQPPPTVTGD